MRSRFANPDYEPNPLDMSEQYETGLKRVGEHTAYAQEDLAFDEGQAKGEASLQEE
jgi:hypothetical protein